MKNIELKDCPNCHERIGIHDVECPYCKYIDDPKYKKHNEKLKKNKKRKKNDIYKMILSIPILTYLIYLLLDIKLSYILIPLILLNFMCIFTKKTWILITMVIEVIILLFNFINRIYNIIQNNSGNLTIEIILFSLGTIFIFIPKIIYITKSKKKRRNKK